MTIRVRVDQERVPSFVRAALREIRHYIKEHQVEVDGPPFAICHPASAHKVDVEAGWPVHRPQANGRVELGALPAGWVRRGRDLGP